MTFPPHTMNNAYICLSNAGEIDTTAMLLIGASTKRDDNTKIGFFGSGLKYALAVLLRNEIPFRIFSGTREIKIKSRPLEFRGKTFGQIYIDGKKTSLTTEMGPDWEPWFAVREVLCNAIDEGDHKIDVAENIEPAVGRTSIYIGMHEKLEKIFNHWQYYFSEKRTDAIHTHGDCRVFLGNKQLLAVYRKGILCHHEHTQSLFHYDMSWIKINESRIIKDQWDFKYNLGYWLAHNATESMVGMIFDQYRDTYEGKLDWDGGYSFNDNWLTMIGDRPLVPQEVAGYFAEEIDTCLVLPASLVTGLSKRFGSKVRVKGQSDKYAGRTIVEKNKRQVAILDDVLAFLRAGEIVIPYEIEVCVFNEDRTLGMAKDGKIYIAPKVFDMGKRQVCLTLLEEYAHLESMEPDRSRGFQNYLLSRFLEAIEVKSGTYL